MMSGVDYRSGGSKYKTKAVKKITPKRFVDDRGKLGYKCRAPGCLEISISSEKMTTHIMQKHLGQSYVCSDCNKVLSSMDGLHHHTKLLMEKKSKDKYLFCLFNNIKSILHFRKKFV